MPTNFSGNPTAAESPSPAPSEGGIPIASLPVDADAFNSASVYQMVKVAMDWIAFITAAARVLFTGSEIADPAAPSALTGTLYMRSNGQATGQTPPLHRTQLVVEWPDGSFDVIAESPRT